MPSALRGPLRFKQKVERPRLRLLGVTVDGLAIPEIHEIAAAAIVDNRRLLIGYQNLHGIYVLHRETGMQEFHNAADIIWIDGMPIMLWGRLLGRSLRGRHRFGMFEWLPLLLQDAAERGWRVFYLGGAPAVLGRAIARFRQRYPKLQLAGQHGYFDPRPNQPQNLWTLDAINAFNPDYLLVGMGMPRQEIWICDNADKLRAPVIHACGAAIDYFGGALAPAPRWMSRCGLEWAFRLGTEPKRLWRRYLLEPFELLPLFADDLRDLGAPESTKARASPKDASELP